MCGVKTVPVLGVPIYKGGISSAVCRVITDLEGGVEQGKTHLISARDANGLVHAQNNTDFKKTLKRFYINLPDGKPVVWIGWWKGAKEMRRCYGPDFFEALMRASAHKPIRHYLSGGKDGVADRLRQACDEKFDNQNVVGTHCPPFRPLTEKELKSLGRDIDDAGTDIVWIGISTPKQERFAARLSKYTSASFIITVGAAFDFHIGKVRQAPSWMQKAGLEWFFRLLMEPRRLSKRVMKVVTGFIYYNLKEFVTGRFY
jgi:N-acetylglucosaminyldiphosphoundecaprenol N-acetyl-beta-D-mannosaminyltransferase